MKKLLLLIPAALMALSAIAQETGDGSQIETPEWTLTINRQNPSNYWPTYDLVKDEILSQSVEWDIYTATVTLPLLNEEQTHVFRFNFTNNRLNKNIKYAEGDGNSYNNLTWNPGDPKEITVFAWTEDDNALKVMLTGLPYHIADDKWSTMGYFPPLTNLTDDYTSTIYFNNYKGNSGLNFLHGTKPSNKPEHFTAGGNRGTISGARPTKACIYEASLNYSNGYASLVEATEIKIKVDELSILTVPANVTLPEGITAYTLSFSDNKLIATLLDNETLPANIPALLRADTPGKLYSFSIVSEIINPDEGTGYKTISEDGYNYLADIEYFLTEDNDNSHLLKGVYQQHQLPSGYDSYILNPTSGKFELTKSTTNGGEILTNSTYIVPAFSGYLQLSDNKWSDDEDLTSIEIVFPEEEEPIEPETPAEILYIHFLDNSDGTNYYVATNNENLFKDPESDTFYSFDKVDFHRGAGEVSNVPHYFILSDKDPGIAEMTKEDIPMPVPKKFDENVSLFGTIYHLADETTTEEPAEEGNDPTPINLNANSPTVPYMKLEKYTEGALRPISLLAGSQYDMSVDLDSLSLVADRTGDSTGIYDVEAPKVNDGKMYNLLGQPVGDDYKGIVIKDGKKYLLK